MVTHLTTNQVRSCLTSWFGRNMYFQYDETISSKTWCWLTIEQSQKERQCQKTTGENHVWFWDLCKLVSFTLWHINSWRLIHTKSDWYIYIKYIWFVNEWFGGNIIFKWARFNLLAHSQIISSSPIKHW